MRAMILAAGRGERMRPLTDITPKPLLTVGGKPLILWHIERLVSAGIREIVINHAWLGSQIEQFLRDGAHLRAHIRYSPESTPLETAGGIAHALPLLGPDPFLVINGDVWCDWDPGQAPAITRQLCQQNKLAWLLLTDNPRHNPHGDFLLLDNALVSDEEILPPKHDRLTFSGIGVYQPSLFHDVDPDKPAKLAPLLRQAMAGGLVTGQAHNGTWIDVGTPQRLAQLDSLLAGPGQNPASALSAPASTPNVSRPSVQQPK